MARAISPADFNKGFEGEVDTLEILNTSREEQERFVGRHTERPPCFRLVAWRKECVLDTERNDMDASGVGIVEIDDLLRLNIAARQHGIRAGHDALFIGRSFARRLAIRQSLDAVQRVKRHHERNIQFVLQPVTSDATKPVVRVQDVGLGIAAHQDTNGTSKVINPQS